MLRCLLLCLLSPALAAAGSFDQDVEPVLREHCIACHNEKLVSGGLNIKGLLDTATVAANRTAWEHVAARVRAGTMPPQGTPRPPAEQIDALLRYLQAEFDRLDKAKPENR